MIPDPTPWIEGALQQVTPAVLLPQCLQVTDEWLQLGGRQVARRNVDRLVVVGAGKVSGVMVDALLDALAGSAWESITREGWVNVPDWGAGARGNIRLFPARSVGDNLPTEQGLIGTREMVNRLKGMGPRDLGFVMISGGGSALLNWPRPGISVRDQRDMIERLNRHGASIEQLNLTRQHLCRVKGGGLLSQVPAGEVFTLILSDVLGDPLPLIASGPTLPALARPREVLETFAKLAIPTSDIPASIWKTLQAQMSEPEPHFLHPPSACQHTAVLIGNLPKAVEALAHAARGQGYSVQTRVQTDPAETVQDVAGRLVADLDDLQRAGAPVCLIDAGEPVLRLTGPRGIGGRNQQLVLLVMKKLLAEFPFAERALLPCRFFSWGTDGEDGNSPIAGGQFDDQSLRELWRQRFDPGLYLDANDAFRFFGRGPFSVRWPANQTNVGDVRLWLVEPPKTGRP